MISPFTAWRGARPENLMQLQEDFPSLNIIKLEQNYQLHRTHPQSCQHLDRQQPSPDQQSTVE